MSELYLDVRTADLRTPIVHPLPRIPEPVTFIDRASLRVGLWLLLRSARSAERQTDHSLRIRRIEHERALLARAAASLHLHQLGPRL